MHDQIPIDAALTARAVDGGQLLRELAAVSAETVAADPSDAGHDVGGVRPSVICRPSTAEEVAAILGVANRDHAAVIPWGAGTRMAVGFPPRAADIALVTTGLDQVVEYEPADLTLTVQAGMRVAALQALLAEHGQMLALDPPGAERATIGGVVASNAFGPLRLQYGAARDLIIGIRVANAEGMLTKAGGRVVKNVTGYDLNKLYAGSFGTLAVIVELSFKLHPLPERRGSTLAIFGTIAEAQTAVQRIVKSPLGPSAIAVMDASAADIDLPRGCVALLAMAAGFERAVARQVRDMGTLCAGASDVRMLDDAASGRAWDSVRAHADLTRNPDDVILKLGVPPAQSGAALQAVKDMAQAAEIDISGIAYAGTGIAHARLHGLLPDDLARGRPFIEEARGWARARGGSLVVERCPDAWKASIDIWGEPDASFRVMTAIKQQFDPNGVLSPGRFLGHL